MHTVSVNSTRPYRTPNKHSQYTLFLSLSCLLSNPAPQPSLYARQAPHDFHPCCSFSIHTPHTNVTLHPPDRRNPLPFHSILLHYFLLDTHSYRYIITGTPQLMLCVRLQDALHEDPTEKKQLEARRVSTVFQCFNTNRPIPSPPDPNR